MSSLKKKRQELGFSLQKIKKESGVPQIIILDLEDSDRYRAHQAYESYREILVQYYRDAVPAPPF